MHKWVIYFWSWGVTELIQKTAKMAQTSSNVILNKKILIYVFILIAYVTDLPK